MSTCPIMLPSGKPCGRESHPKSWHDLCPEHWVEIINEHKTAQFPPDHLLLSVSCPICHAEIRTGPGLRVECPNPTCWDDRWWEQPNPEMEVPARQGTSWVYYIRFGDRIKIGTSTNVKARLNTLPYDELIALEPGGVRLERERQRMFAGHLIPGQREWFHDHADIRAHVAAVRAEHGDPTSKLRRPA